MILTKSNNGDKAIIFSGSEDACFDRLFCEVGRYIVNEQFSLYSVFIGTDLNTNGVSLIKTYNGVTYRIELKLEQ